MHADVQVRGLFAVCIPHVNICSRIISPDRRPVCYFEFYNGRAFHLTPDKLRMIEVRDLNKTMPRPRSLHPSSTSRPILRFRNVITTGRPRYQICFVRHLAVGDWMPSRPRWRTKTKQCLLTHRELGKGRIGEKIGGGEQKQGW
jgi:hypothetical protein